MHRVFLVIVICSLAFSNCTEPELRLSPRLIKEVDKRLRKEKKAIASEADSLCLLYAEKNQQRLIDSLLEKRLKEDEKKRIRVD